PPPSAELKLTAPKFCVTLAEATVEDSEAFAVCDTQKAQAAVAILIIVVVNIRPVLLFIYPLKK
ncbi:hypothetical protein HMPREF1572_00967, partial [Gardnerella vaginalis JCP7275]